MRKFNVSQIHQVIVDEFVIGVHLDNSADCWEAVIAMATKVWNCSQVCHLRIAHPDP